jgi:hypothetical protein
LPKPTHSQRPTSRHPTVLAASLLVTILIVLSGCANGKPMKTVQSATRPEPQYAPESLTHQEQLVHQGAQLIVSDGCAACHLSGAMKRAAPSFSSFAGHQATLTNGHHALIDEYLLREALSHAGRYSLKGYDPGPMSAVAQRLHLNSHPAQVQALAAFIEQIGAE